MPGKYTALKKTDKNPTGLEQAPTDSRYQEKLNEIKQQLGLRSRPKEKVAEMMIVAEVRKEAAKEKLKEATALVEALSQHLVDEFEADGVSKVTLGSGETLYIKDSPYCSVEDRHKFIQWIRETNQEELLTVHYQTISGLANDRLLKGQPVMPGIKAFMKSSIVVLGIKKAQRSEHGEQGTDVSEAG